MLRWQLREPKSFIQNPEHLSVLFLRVQLEVEGHVVQQLRERQKEMERMMEEREMELVSRTEERERDGRQLEEVWRR